MFGAAQARAPQNNAKSLYRSSKDHDGRLWAMVQPKSPERAHAIYIRTTIYGTKYVFVCSNERVLKEACSVSTIDHVFFEQKTKQNRLKS